MMKKHLLPTIPLLLLVLMFFAGCRPSTEGPGDTDPDSVAVEGDWVRIYQSADPDVLHPFNSRTGMATIIKENIFMYLADYNTQTLKPEYTLAAGAPQVSADGMSFTYEIRPEAKWDNGEPITGKDYEFSVKCVKSSLNAAPHLRSYHTYLDDVKVDPANERRFTVTINEKFFLATTGIEGIEVISHKFYDPKGALAKYSVKDMVTKEAEIAADSAAVQFFRDFNSDKFSVEPANIYGPGPYKVESWTAGDNVTLVRKKDWWGKELRGKSFYYQGYADKLIYKTILDRSTLPAAAKNGELDVIKDMAPDDFIAARDDTSGYIYKHFNFLTPLSYNNIFVGFNCKPGVGRKPFFEDVRVRQAIAHCTDIDGIINNVYNGLAKRQNGPVSPVHTDEYDESVKPYEFNPEKAKGLLDAAGWVDSDGNGLRDKMINGRKVDFKVECAISNSGDTGPRMIAMIADECKKVGLEINVVRLPFGELSEKARTHEFDMFGMGFSTGPLPTDFKQVWATENWVNNGSNYFGFGDSLTDALINEIRVTESAAARKPLYSKFQRMWMDRLPCIFIMAPQERVLVDKRFRNAKATNIRPGYKAYEFWVPKAEQKFK